MKKSETRTLRNKRRELEKEIREKSIWSDATIELTLTYKGKDGKEKDETMEFHVIHNLPDIPSMCIEDAVENWKVRTEVHTAQSLCDYINSKTHMTGHTAMTIKEYKKLNDDKEPEYIKSKAIVNPNNRGGTGHYDDSLSDADPGL